MLPPKRNSIIGGWARALIERWSADFRTRDGSSDWRSVQRKARRVARLRHLHGLMPRQRAARPVMQEIVARRRIVETRNDMIHSERKLCIRREVGGCI